MKGPMPTQTHAHTHINDTYTQNGRHGRGHALALYDSPPPQALIPTTLLVNPSKRYVGVNVYYCCGFDLSFWLVHLAPQD